MRPGHLVLILAAFISLSYEIQAQLVSDLGDESKLYAETKQVNQFFRRFNGEEDERGERYYPKDKDYRNLKLRKKYLSILFDESNEGISKELKNEFADQVLDKRNPIYLDFHDPDWFAEVNTVFLLKGKEIPVTIYLQLEQQHKGSKWVIYEIFSPFINNYFERDTSQTSTFLHPLSHELDFMNFHKAFGKTDKVTDYTYRGYHPDQTSIFLYEIKNGNLKYQTVTTVRFHVFQIDGWYFELSDFNRPGYNRGWLISDLVKVNKDEVSLLKKFIMNEK